VLGNLKAIPLWVTWALCLLKVWWTTSADCKLKRWSAQGRWCAGVPGLRGRGIPRRLLPGRALEERTHFQQRTDSMPQLCPGWLHPAWRLVDEKVRPLSLKHPAFRRHHGVIQSFGIIWPEYARTVSNLLGHPSFANNYRECTNVRAQFRTGRYLPWASLWDPWAEGPTIKETSHLCRTYRLGSLADALACLVALLKHGVATGRAHTSTCWSKAPSYFSIPRFGTYCRPRLPFFVHLSFGVPPGALAKFCLFDPFSELMSKSPFNVFQLYTRRFECASHTCFERHSWPLLILDTMHPQRERER
jgi:hypothetical protein